MNRKHVSKLIALFLALSCLVSLIGCGTSSSTAATAATAAAGNSTTTKSSAPAYLNTASDYPIVKEKITMDGLYVNHPMNGDVTKYACWDRLEKLTNVHWNLEIVPATSISEKVNLRMASSTLPAAIFGSGAFTDVELTKYSSKGALLKLENLIASYAPNITKAFNDNPAIKKFVTLVDGSIYSLPRDEGSNGQHLVPKDASVVNKKWLDTLKMSVPTTYDEFYAMLKAFKTQDPNGNGQADEVPLGFAAGQRIYNMGVFASMGVTLTDTNEYMMMQGKKVAFGPATDAYKEGLKMLQKWYGEGLIEPEAFTISPQNFNAKAIKSPSPFGVIFTNIPTSFLSAKQCTDEYVVIPPLKAADGTQRAATKSVISYRACAELTKDCKYPEAAIRWFDYFFTTDGYAEAIFGEPDVNWKKDATGHYSTITPANGAQMIQFMYQNNPRSWVGIEPKSFNADLLPDNKILYPMLEPLKKYYDSSLFWPMLTFTSKDSEVINMYVADLNNYAKQKQAEMIMNAKINIDTEWDKYISELKKMGLTEVVAIYQARYDQEAK